MTGSAAGSRLRLVFLGSGEFGLPTLGRLCADHDVVAVISQPDRPAGRKRQLTATPIAAWAEANSLPVIKPENINAPAVIDDIIALRADAAVVIAFGQKLSPQVIESLGGLVVNLHASLLPKYRGAAPINWAIINGETESGVTVIGLAQRMDAGCIYAAATTVIDELETAGELHDRLAALGPEVIADVLAHFADGNLTSWEQDESLATKAPKLSRADSAVDFNQDAKTVCRRIHGLTPWPGVKATWSDASETAHDLTLVRARALPTHAHSAQPGTLLPGGLVATREGAIMLLDVQPPGKRVMTLRQYMNGHPFEPGICLHS